MADRMSDGRSLATQDVGAELRRIMSVRRLRRRRLVLAALGGCATASLIASAVWKVPLLLLWNASASAPVGLYRVDAGALPRTGDMAIAWTPEPARALAARRHYLPANVPLVKRVAAAAGDQVCADGSSIGINGRPVAARQALDGAGRPMPWWSGCRLLRSHEYFLLMDSARSFDGRYFGVTAGGNILGRAELLWAKPSAGSCDG